ncbi:MAG: vitamin B12-dependent ribonucleotide reductase, partial [Verrucomicrobia bacterium]
MIQLKPGISASQFNKGRKGRARARIRRGTGTQRAGLHFKRVFSDAKSAPFDEMEWERRIAEITDDGGKIIFKQDNIEVPADWSELATKIAVSKYFYGDIANGTDPEKGGRETSVRQLIHRVTRTIADWGLLDGYFADAQTADLFYDELTWLCLNQHGAFNSPVWFNVGLYQQYGIGNGAGEGNYFYNRETGTADRAATQYEYPQGSACFIQSVDDTMEDIMRLATSEAMLFKYGSGTGSDLSTLRSTREKLSGGGKPSGPLSFLKVYDQVANVVKSGGKTRRAAKMNTLKDWHPDIEEFIDAKQKEEKKAWALIEQGYDGSYNGDAYGSVMYQNENLSVRVSDEFMHAALEDREWWTRRVRDGSPCERKDARILLRKIAEGTHICGDPGMQFD